MSFEVGQLVNTPIGRSRILVLADGGFLVLVVNQVSHQKWFLGSMIVAIPPLVQLAEAAE